MHREKEDISLEALARRYWPWLALTGCALFVHLAELRGRVTYWRDVHLANLPGHDYMAEVLHHGELPQWFPFDGGGSPFLATPPAEVFHPSVLLYALLPGISALVLHGLLATLLAMWGGYALARTLGQPKHAAFVVGLVFGGNGYLTCLVEQTFMLVAAATIPWYVASLVVAARRGGRWLVAPAAMFALQLLAGDPQAAILAAFAGLVVAVAVQPGRRAAFLAIASPLLGAVLSAVQIIPALRLIGQTDRAGTPVLQDKWPLEAKHLAGMFLPLIQNPIDFIWSTSLGLAVMALVAASLVALRRRRVVAALWVLVVVGIWLGLGKGYGLTELARAVVPLWAKFRYSVKSVLLVMFALSLLAGEGVWQLSGKRRPKALRAAWGAVALGIGLAVVLVASIPWWIAFTLAGATVAVLFVPLRGPMRAVVPFAIAGQVLAFTPPLIPTTDPATFAEPPLAIRLRELGAGLTGPAVERFEDREFPLTMMADLTVSGVAGAGTSTGALWRIPSVSAYALAGSGRLRRLVEFERTVTRKAGIELYGRLGAGFVIEPLAEVPPGAEVVGHEFAFDYAAVRVPGALPRAFVVRCARRVDGVDDGATLLRSTAFDAHRQILVEGAGEASCPADGPEDVPAQVVGRTNTTVQLSVDAPWDGWLLLNEAYFEGWTALVDGVPAAIRPGNVVMRAIQVPAGQHRVTFRYETPGLVLGAWISAVAACVLAAVWLVLSLRAVR